MRLGCILQPSQKGVKPDQGLRLARDLNLGLLNGQASGNYEAGWQQRCTVGPDLHQCLYSDGENINVRRKGNV